MTQDVYTARRTRRFTQHQIRGLTYHVSEWGETDAPLLVFLHGWGDTGSTFQFVVDALRGSWHVIAPDWRGFGRTAHAAGGYWFPDYLADLDALLAIYAPDAPVALIGHSMGGNVAGLYAGARPRRVRALVNVEGFGLPDRVAEEAPDQYAVWLDRVADPPAYTTYRSFDELVPRIVNNSPRLAPDRAQFVAREWAQSHGDGIVRLRADPRHKLPNPVLYRRAEAEACWRRVEAQVLLVMGRETPFTAAARTWIETRDSRRPFPGAPLAQIADCGHMVHFEAPGELATQIESFIRA